MTEKPILALSEAIGRDATDRVSISYYNDSTEWTTKQIQARFADVLAASLTDQKLNVYVMVNTAQDVIHGRGNVNDIIQVNALWADLDVKEGGMPSLESAMNVIDMLSSMLNCKPAAIVHSGHGLQPYWHLEEASVSPMNRNYMIGLIKRWGYLVARVAEIEGGKVDSVFDLPRVLRAPGSKNWKDPENVVEATLELNEWTHPLTTEEVEELVISYGFIHEDLTVDEFVVVSPPAEWQPATHDCEWARSLAREIDKGEPNARHPWLLGKAVKIEVAARNGCFTEETYGKTVALLEAKFKHLLTLGQHPRTAAPGEVNTAFKWARASVSTFSDAKMADNLNYHTHKPMLYAVPDLPKESTAGFSGTDDSFPVDGALALAPDVVPIALADNNFRYTDAANAERLANAALGKFTYVPSLGWYTWRDGRYVRDESNSIIRLAIDTVKAAAAEDVTDDGIKWAQRSMSANLLAASVRLAESVPEMVTVTTHLDSNALELCTPGGIVSLDRGELRNADPMLDMNTRQTKVTPKPGPHPKFSKFLKTTLEDEERIEYMQDLFGVALIGEVRWHILPIFSGAGANGKSTLLDIAGAVLGDYSAIMPENFLLDGAKTEHSTEIARLRGVRLAIASETRPDGKFNESRVKMLTGEPTLSARSMRQDFIDFKATHTLFLALNHPPTVRSGGDGFWRRLRKIDFNYQVPKRERDPNLAADIVREEGPQILNWMIEGARRVLQRGLIEPASIEEATAMYREEEDHLDNWLKECTAISEHITHSTAEIYGNYVAWCRKSGEQPISNVALIRDIRQRLPIVPFRKGRYRGWKGLLLYVEEEA